MKFRKQKKARRPYYGKVTRDAMKEQMYAEAARAIANGKSPDDIVTAYNIMVNPVRR